MVISGGWMMGPAFISAPESASPQASITPGKALAMTASAWSLRVSGNTPVGRRLARMVIATSSGPCLRVSHGSVPGLGKGHVGAIAGITCGLGKQHRAERARRQEHDLSVDEMRREHLRDVGLRGRGRRAQDQLRAAHGLGHVGGDERRARTSWRPRKSFTMICATGVAMRGNRLRVAPPQPHLVPGQRQIAGRRERPVSSA